MNKAYNRINWENYPSDSTPLNEDNLNKMDVAINEVDNRVISIETTKLPVATAYTMVKDVTFDEKTGVFTITKLNGSVIKIDTALEKISTNFRFDHSTQKLILTLIDGTTQEVDLSALLTQYEFTDSDTIAFTVDTSGKVVASVKKGSITQDMLEPNYLANIKVEVAKAESASFSADTSAKNAKTSETNAKTSEEKAREYAEASSGIGALISSFVTGTNPTIQDSTNAPLIYGKFKGYTLQDGEPTPDNPVEINGLAKDGAIKVKTCGKNLFNSNTVIVGEIIQADGTFKAYTAEENYTRSQYSRSEYIPCDANTNYYFENVMPLSVAYTVGCYDENKQFLRKLAFSGNAEKVSGVLNTGDNTKYMVVCYKTTNVDTVMVAKSDTATPYEPYTETTTAITIGAPLYEGDYIEIYADGSGKLFRAMAEVVFDGSDDELWNKSDSQTGNFYMLFTAFDAVCKPKIKDNITKEPFCSHLKYATYGLDFAIGNITVSNAAIHLWITDGSEISDIDEYKAWLAENPITVVYELEEPTETPITAEQVEQFKQLYTFEPVTNVFCDGEVELLYYKNTDNGETVGIVHKKVEKNERAVNSANNYYSSFKQTFDTVVGGTVSNNTSNVEYTEPSFSKNGSIMQMINKGGTLVNGLKSVTAKIAETLSSMCDFFIGKIAYNIGGKEIINDFDYENWITEKSEAVEGTVEYPSNTLERFERLIAQCVEASIKLNDSLKWKMHTSAEGLYPSIDLPSTYNELLIEALYTESSSVVRRTVIIIPSSLLSSEQTRRYYAGYHYTSTQNLCVGYNMILNNITVVGAKYNGGASDVSVKIIVYYR